MGLFNKLLGRNTGSSNWAHNNTITIDGSLGNVLMAGNSRSGKALIIGNYSIGMINSGAGCIIIRSTYDGFSAYPNITTQRSMIYGIDTGDGAFTEQFDPFSNLNESQKVELIFNIFNKYVEFDSSLKMKFKQYVSKVIKLAKAYGKNLQLNELSQYTIEKLEDMNARSRLSDAEKHQNERFFDSVRQDVSILESYFYDFANNNIGFILSGTKTLEQIINSGRIIEVTLDFSTRKEESELLLSILTDKIYKLDYAMLGRKVAVVVDEVPNDSLLKCGFDKLMMTPDKCHMVYSIMDIASLAEKTNVFIDKADSLFFFQQQSNKNQEFCSEFFGTYEKQKVSTTQTSGSSYGSSSSSGWSSNSDSWGWNSNRNYGHNSSTNTSSSTTYTTEKERIYLPDVFKDLPENQCIFFFRSSRTHNYLNLG